MWNQVEREQKYWMKIENSVLGEKSKGFFTLILLRNILF